MPSSVNDVAICMAVELTDSVIADKDYTTASNSCTYHTVVVAFLDAEESHGCHVSHLLPSDGLLTVIGGLSPTHCM